MTGCGKGLSKFEGGEPFVMRQGLIDEGGIVGGQVGQGAFGVFEAGGFVHGVVPMRRPDAVIGFGARGPVQHAVGVGDAQRRTQAGQRLRGVGADVGGIDDQGGVAKGVCDLIKQFGLLDKAEVGPSRFLA